MPKLRLWYKALCVTSLSLFLSIRAPIYIQHLTATGYLTDVHDADTPTHLARCGQTELTDEHLRETN